MKNILISFLAGAILTLASPANAAVVDFDDVSAGGKLSTLSKYNPYAGLTWTNSWFLGDTAVNGYSNGAHSGTQFVSNGFGVNNLGISSATAFNLDGAWFATPATNGSKATWINITAYDAANQLIGSTGDIAINGSYSWVPAGFANVSRLTITRDKGWFVMDDLSMSAIGPVPSPVPEPRGVVLLAAGLLMTGFAAKRRQS
ncbi:PEP-CTERM sorting domain-containing protein [Oxalobacteraceae bacterium OTU3CINTB1]|nr:PEP-CTERM sorting domain-containing protein [Oxalobacteraceae bacterium OTU3CINTB1]